MLSDLKYTLRQIVRSPGYTAVVVLTLALGIAVNTQIFAMVNAIFLQPMKVRDADRLTVIVERSDLFSMPHGVSFLDFKDLREGSRALTDHIAYFFSPVHLSASGGAPERAWVEAVTPDAFDKMGVSTVLGRPLQPADGETAPATPVAVLTHDTWQTRFGSDPDIVGKTIQFNSLPFTVVGVSRPGFGSFSYSLAVAAFVPSGMLPQLNPNGAAFFEYRSAKAWRVLAYRQPSSSLAEVNAELALFAERFAKDFPADHKNSRFQAVPEQRARPDPSVADFLPVFIVLFIGLVALVLFIACANVANLMSARALNREKELVVRAALGASRARLIRQLLVESTVLALLAGIVGMLLVVWGSGLLEQFAPKGDVPIRPPDAPAWQMIAFTAGISLVAGVTAGLLPALRSSRIDLNESLKQGAGRGMAGGRHRWRNLLVIGQVAMSCVVLVAAALFLRGLSAAGDLPLGFRPERLLMLSFDLSLQGYNEQRGLQFQKRLLEDTRALPGVEAATLAQHLPFNNNIKVARIWPENPSAHLPTRDVAVSLSAVDPGFGATMGLPLLRGRQLADSDDARAPRVAVINEAMAKTLWPGRDALGERLRLDWDGGPLVEVVGVVATGKYIMLTEEPKPYFYVPFAQRYGMPATLVVRTAMDPGALAQAARETIQRLDPDLPIYDVLTFEDHLAQSAFALMPLRAGAMLAAIQ
ncbi:MAG TPA: ABC transporter permease, partial [Candidatus Synoicihabitans sp.]|nr:ABC transporter permease [Candidatus Synoicihabitans sp.]